MLVIKTNHSLTETKMAKKVLATKKGEKIQYNYKYKYNFYH